MSNRYKMTDLERHFRRDAWAMRRAAWILWQMAIKQPDGTAVASGADLREAVVEAHKDYTVINGQSKTQNRLSLLKIVEAINSKANMSRHGVSDDVDFITYTPNSEPDAKNYYTLNWKPAIVSRPALNDGAKPRSLFDNEPATLEPMDPQRGYGQPYGYLPNKPAEDVATIAAVLARYPPEKWSELANSARGLAGLMNGQPITINGGN